MKEKKIIKLKHAPKQLKKSWQNDGAHYIYIFIVAALISAVLSDFLWAVFAFTLKGKSRGQANFEWEGGRRQSILFFFLKPLSASDSECFFLVKGEIRAPRHHACALLKMQNPWWHLLRC